MGTTAKVTITKTLESWQGIEDLIKRMQNESSQQLELEIIDLVCEDLYAFIHNAEWEIKLIPIVE